MTARGAEPGELATTCDLAGTDDGSEGLRPTHVEIDLEAISDNVAAIATHVAPAGVMPILKANAYGHGLVEVARHLEDRGTGVVGVAYLEEGLTLRRAGIGLDIVVLGGIVGSQIPAFLRHDLQITVPSVDKLAQVDAAAAALGRRARVHLKFDTGMERIGVHWYSAGPLVEAALASRHVDVVGVYSHLANSDDPDLRDARRQVERFEAVLDHWRRRSEPLPTRHLANSGAVLALPEAHYDLVRPGILCYGVAPSDEAVVTIPVRPAMRWVTRVVYFKVVEAGHPVSYGSTWAPAARTRLVTLPVGYGDGYLRAASNRAEVLVGGQRRRVVGRICMDQTMVDLTAEGSAYNGDEVVLLGRQGDEEISAAELAAHAGTIAYEVLTNVNARVPRRHLRPR